MQTNRLMTSITKKIQWLVLVMATTILASGCEFSGNTIQDVVDGFNSINPFVKNTSRVKRAPLVDFPAEVELNEEWDNTIGDGLGSEYIKLNPVIAGERIFAADSDGLVMAVNIENGDEIWQVNLQTPIGGGLGLGDGILAIGSEEGEVIVIAQENGETLWRAPVSSEILSIPAINDEIIAVQTLDGKLYGFNVETGARRWIYETTVPALSLRGTSSPIINNNLVYAGFSNGKLVAVNSRNGDVSWENQVAIPQGRSDIERLVDVDGTPLLVDSILYVTSFQGRVVALNARTGRLLWQQESSSYQSIGEGFGNIYLADEDSRLIAYDQETNQVLWDQPAFENRDITAPTVFKNYIVFGDYDGYLHLISQVDGHLVGRIKVGDKGIRTSPLVTEDTLYILTNDGKLAALSLNLLEEEASQESLEQPEKPDTDFSN